MNSDQKSDNSIDTDILDVNPDTEYTIRILEQTVERIKARKEDPNIVYNVLSQAMAELIPYPTGELFQKHRLMTFDPDQKDYMPSESKMHAIREVEAIVDGLKEENTPVQDIQAALLDEFIRLFPANPYRDPVDVKAVERDYLYAEYAINRLSDMMKALYRALNRAVSQQEAEASKSDND